MSGPMNHSPADVLRNVLVGLSVGTLPNANSTWPISVDNELDTPDNTITVYDVGGRDAGRDMPTGHRTEYPGIQVRVRAKDFTTGYVKAQAIGIVLDQTINSTSITIEGSSYTITCFHRSSNVISLGKDQPTTRRNLFTINGTMTIRKN
jgi:hypothetical protein